MNSDQVATDESNKAIDPSVIQPGPSAYQIWLDFGNKGTPEEFLEWLRSAELIEVKGENHDASFC